MSACIDSVDRWARTATHTDHGLRFEEESSYWPTLGEAQSAPFGSGHTGAMAAACVACGAGSAGMFENLTRGDPHPVQTTGHLMVGSTFDAALLDAADSLYTMESMDQNLQRMVEVARDSLREIDHAGVTLARQATVQTTAATDDFVVEVDRVQYGLGTGPCLDKLRTTEIITVVDHVRAGGRAWPEFLARAAEMGVRSMIAVRLFRNDDTLGVMNLYSTSHDVINGDTREVALMFAGHASIAYSHNLQVANLRRAVQNREMVGQASGIIMERYQLGPERAFDYLVRVSSTTETKLRDVAQHVVDAVGDPGR